MTLTTEQASVVDRIGKRLRSTDEATYRAGGRAVALQAIEHRAEIVRTLRNVVGELGESSCSERLRGYREALLDMLVAAEAALEPRELESQARRELSATPHLQETLDVLALAPNTPGEVAKRIRRSAASAGRYLARLRELGLIVEMPSASDARERPQRATVLGTKLARSKAQGTGAEPMSETGARRRVVTQTTTDRLLEYAKLSGAVRIDADPATGLRMPENFEALLASQVELHRKARLPLSLMRLDIRNFHEFVDSERFPGATRLIHRVAEMLKEELGGTSAEVARYDFDKFIVMLPRQPEADARRLARAVLSKLAPIAANVGIASDLGDRDAETLLSASDIALQAAKESGTTVAVA